MSKEKQIELKPCPFCGGKAKVKRYFLDDPRVCRRGENFFLEQNFCIACESCKFETPEFAVSIGINQHDLSLTSTLEQEAKSIVDRWNRRADNDQREAD